MVIVFQRIPVFMNVVKDNHLLFSSEVNGYGNL